jgi:hypothetical protein
MIRPRRAAWCIRRATTASALQTRAAPASPFDRPAGAPARRPDRWHPGFADLAIHGGKDRPELDGESPTPCQARRGFHCNELLVERGIDSSETRISAGGVAGAAAILGPVLFQCSRSRGDLILRLAVDHGVRLGAAQRANSDAAIGFELLGDRIGGVGFHDCDPFKLWNML